MEELDHLGWVVSRAYEIGGIGFGLRTNSHACGKWLDDTLGEYRIDEQLDPYYSLHIAESDGGPGRRFHILYSQSRAVTKTYDLRTLGRAFLAHIASIEHGDRDDAIYAKAAFVAGNGSVALVPRVFVEYLLTLSRRERARSGLAFPVTTSVAIDLDSARPIIPLSSLQVSDEALERLAQLAPSAPDETKGLDELPARVDVVCSLATVPELLNWVSPGLALYRLASHVVNLDRLGVRGLEGLKGVVERARCYEVSTEAKPKDMLESLARTLTA